MLPTIPEVESLIDRALLEDLSIGDPTTDLLIPPTLLGIGKIFSKGHGVLCGVQVAAAVFHRLDPSLHVEATLADGAPLEQGSTVARLRGSVAGMLKGERVALNFLQHLSGIATATARYVEAVRGLKVRIVDTRKTVPGIRALEKYAVQVGGGHNHRRNLGDGILIKDNHLAVLRAQGRNLRAVVAQAVEKASHTIKVEVEVTSVTEAQEALDAGAHLLLLDNMPLDEMRQVVKLVRGRAKLEASGGITLETVRAVAETGVDLISVGALTHSAKSLDISMDVEAD